MKLDLSNMVAAPEQPGIWEVATNDGVFVKQMHIAKAGTFIPQHSHEYTHSSLLAVGSVRLWREELYVADYVAPTILSIEAGIKHMFQALEDNTVVYCIHNISRTSQYEFLEEHDVLGVNGNEA